MSKMRLLRSFIDKYKDIIFLFLLSLVPLIWYGADPAKLIVSHDVGYPLNPAELVKNRLFAWSSGINFGSPQTSISGTILYHSLEAFLTFLTGSLFSGQKVYVILWFFVPMLAIYIFLKRLPVFRDKPYIAILGAVLYQFNLFQLQGWRVFWRTRFSIAALLPLVLLFLIDYLEGRRRLFKTAILIGLTAFFLNGGGSPPLFGALILLVGVTIVYYLLLSFPKKVLVFAKKSFVFLVATTVVSFIISLFWTLPYTHHAFSSFADVMRTLGGPISVISWAGMVSRNSNILNLLRLQGFDFLEITSKQEFVRHFLTNPVLIGASFLLPILAFSSLFLAKKSEEKKYVLLFWFLALVGVVFTAGIHEPFKGFYIFLLKNVPGFPIFRTPLYKFGGLLWFSYAVLIAFSLSCFIEKTRKDSKVPFILATLFIILIIAYDFPIFDKRFFDWKPPLTMLETVPDYVFDYGKWMNKQKDFSSRTLLLPDFNKTRLGEAFRWGYWSLSTVTSYLTQKNTLSNDSKLVDTEPSLVNSLYELLRKDKPAWSRLARFLDVRYFLLRKDFFYDLSWTPTTSPSIYEKVLEKSDKIEKVETFGEWVVYQLEDNEFLPRFYIPEEFIFIQGEVYELAEVLSFEDWQVRTGIHFPEKTGKRAVKVEEMDKIFVVAGCIRCGEFEKPEIELPFVRFLPDSVFYPLISWKEKGLERQIKEPDDPSQIIDLDLGLASKRLVEIGGLLDERESKEAVKETIKRYQARIEDVSYQLERMEKEGRSTNEVLLRMEDYLKGHKAGIKELLKKWIGDGTWIGDETRIRLEGVLWELEDLLVEIKSKQWVSEERAKRYIFDIPKETDYELFIKSEGIEDYFTQNPLDPIVFELDGKLATKPGELRSDSWILVDKVNLEKRRHKLAIILPEAKNLVEKESLLLEQEEEGRKTVSLPINNFDPDGLYKISFDYETLRGQSTKFIVIQDTDKKDEELGRVRYKVEEDLHREAFPQTFEVFFKPDFGAKKAELGFVLEADEEEKSIFEIEEMRVERVWSPEVILRTATREELVTQKIPKITFRKINPTKYEVKIEGANRPYTLVFNESFHQGWKAYIGRREPISEDKHYLINGYANSWYITPEDAGEAENYEIMIEFWPQRLFHIGMIVSALSLLGSLGYLGWSLVKKR